MKMLLSLMLAVVMSLTPALASLPLGVGVTPAQAAQNAGLSVPFVARVTSDSSQPGLPVGTQIPGTLNIQRFVAQNGEAVAVGTATLLIPGRAPTVVPVAVNVIRGQQGGVTAQQAACDILHLVLGPLHIDLLGLIIDLNEVHLDIVAQPGPGNLLGNLLCAIVGLLDGTGPLGQLVAALNRLVEALNNL